MDGQESEGCVRCFLPIWGFGIMFARKEPMKPRATIPLCIHHVQRLGLFLPLIYAFLIMVATSTALAEYQNLDFESANMQQYPSPEGEPIPISDAFPGWKAYYREDQTSYVSYDTSGLDASYISIFDNKSHYYPLISSIDGEYSASLDALRSPIAIAQTGTIPLRSLSVSFLLRNNREGSLVLTFDGHVLPYVKTWSEPTFDVCAADISAFAGQTGELRFTENSGWNVIDDIQFSPDAVPEPGTIALFGMGALALMGRMAFRKA